MGQSNLALIYENYADAAVLSGGGWQAGSLGLDNLRTPYFPEVARSASVQPSDTQLQVDLRGFFPVSGIALGPCSVTAYAEARIRAYFDVARSQLAYDSGVIPFPGTRVDSTLLEWEDPGFWEGISQDFNDLGKGTLLLHFLSFPIFAQFWTLEIIDPGNPAGFIDISRLYMGRVWQPKYNYGYDGNSFDVESLTDMEESRSGTRFFNERGRRRTFAFGFDYLPEDDTFRDVYRISTRSGTSRQVVVIPNPSDETSFQREAFIGTLGIMPSLRRASFGSAATSFKIEEAL